MDMKCLLIEIRKFLKRLETGQMELEAGQWELHKEISHLKTSVESLEILKQDLQQMKNQGIRQTELIKKLQNKLGILEDIRKVDDGDHWSSFSSNYEPNYSFNECNFKQKNLPKFRDRPKTTNPGRNDECQPQEVFHIGEQLLRLKHEKEINANKDIRQDDTKLLRKSKQQNATQGPHKSSSISLLHRYLNDSARYLNKQVKKSQKSHKSKTRTAFPGKALSESLKIETQSDSTPSLLVKSKVTSPRRQKYNCFKCSKKLRIENFPSHYRIHNTKSLYLCDVCRKKFFLKSNCKKHERVHHGVKDLSQKKQMTKRFRGFKCSYCDKICRSPDKLTEHLESCRIIVRRNRRRK